MTLALADRVRETTTVVGTGDATLLGPVTGYQSFAVIGNGNTCYYTIADQGGPNWEVGIGTYSAAGPTLARTTVLSSSNGGAAVTFTAGTKDIFVTYPSEKAVYLDSLGDLSIVANSSSDALRITQTGSGNALLVEDSAHPDATPFVVTADGKVGVGVDGSAIAGNIALMVSADNGNGRGLFQRMTDDTGGAQVYLRKGRGTINSPVVVQSGDRLGTLSYAGWGDSSNAYEAASIYSEVDGTPGTGDMPGRLVFSTTKDGASSPTEAMRIRSDQNIAIGTTGNVNVTLTLGKDITGSTTASSIYNAAIVKSDVTGAANINWTNIFTQAAAFTLTSLRHYLAAQNTIGAGSTVTNQQGFYVDSSLTGATNNYGFYSNIASGTGRYNFYAAGSADNFMAGRLGLGSSAGQVGLYNTLNITGATTSWANYVNATIQSDVTNAAFGYQTYLNSAASAFTLGALTHYQASQGTIGAGSTVTSQFGFYAQSTLTGATYNYGFYGNIAAGANRYNLYMNGTADNFMAGAVGVGTAVAAYAKLQVGGTLPSSTGYSYGISSAGTIPSTTTNGYIGFDSAPSVAAGSFTLSSLNHYQTYQGTIGAGATVTNQIGYLAGASLTGATNNFGVVSNIASGTGRWNFYAGGTADNYFAGNVGIGVGPLTTGLTLSASTAFAPQILARAKSADANSGYLLFQKDRSSAIVQSGDNLGVLQFTGYDGAGYIAAASIQATLDGTPGTNDMPGRIVFSTTADGASSPTERMRIDNAGQVGIGAAPVAGSSLSVRKNITGGTTAYGVLSYATILSDVTAGANMFQSLPATQAAVFTLGSLCHFYANQATQGAGSVITNQFGFRSESNLTGATNNYGFYSAIAAASGRYNFYAAGSADNYFGGKVGIGVAPNWTQALYDTNAVYSQYVNSFTGSASTDGLLVGVDTSQQAIFRNRENTATLFYTNDTERMRIDSAGNVGIGAAAAAGVTLNVQKNITGAATAVQVYGYSVVLSDVTTKASVFGSYVGTQAAAFTLPILEHYAAYQSTIGAGSTVTNQYGFHATNLLTGATNNYGFYSNIASGTGRYNFYAAGSAANYFAGSVTTETALFVSTYNAQAVVSISCYNNTVAGPSRLYIKSGSSGTNYASSGSALGEILLTSYAAYSGGATVSSYATENHSASALGGDLRFYSTPNGSTAATERMRIDSSGNVIQSAPTTAPTLSTNGTMVFNLTSNTNLRVSVRGSDGVTRTANITLA